MQLLPERLRQARQGVAWTQAETVEKLAERGLPYTRQALTMWEAGIRDVPVEVLAALAELYSVSVDWLLGLTDDPLPHDRHVYVKTRTIPIVSRVDADRPWTASQPEGAMTIVDETRRVLFGLRLDEQVGPDLHAGSIAIVHVTDDAPDGSWALVSWPGLDRAVVRRIYRTGDTAILQAEGRAPEAIPLNSLRILGRVVGVQTMFEAEPAPVE